MFLVLYVDDILLASNNLGMIRETKQFLSQNFDMKDIGEASYVIGIEIYRDRSRKILGLSQKAYINKILEMFNMKNCSTSVAPIVKGDKFSLSQYPKNSLKIKSIKNIPYASAVGSLVYLEVCTRPDIGFAVGILGRYQSNPGLDHWKAAKKVLRYLQGTKDYMLTYRKIQSAGANWILRCRFSRMCRFKKVYFRIHLYDGWWYSCLEKYQTVTCSFIDNGGRVCCML